MQFQVLLDLAVGFSCISALIFLSIDNQYITIFYSDISFEIYQKNAKLRLPKRF
jgi:hypothetical protein